MKDDVKEVVRSVLTDYIETNHCRKTPERFAVLDAAYSLGGFFRTEDLVEELAQRNFHVSRGTLFNSLRLFVELRLLIRHRFLNGTRYEACYKNESHCHQICTVCGKAIDVDIPGISDLLQDAKMRRFRKDRYALYIYGVCSACQLKEKRKRVAIKNENKK